MFAQKTSMRPAHVFGDTLSRVGLRTRTMLRRLHDTAVELHEEKTKASKGKEEQGARRAICEEVGEWMMKKVTSYMREVVFNLDARAFCYACRQQCRIHGPEPGSCSDEVGTRTYGDCGNHLHIVGCHGQGMQLAGAFQSCPSWFGRLKRSLAWQPPT